MSKNYHFLAFLLVLLSKNSVILADKPAEESMTSKKAEFRLDDGSQQEAYRRLLRFLSELDDFQLKSIKDILLEVDHCSKQVDCCEDLQEDVQELKSKVSSLETENQELRMKVNVNSMDIAILQDTTFSLDQTTKELQSNHDKDNDLLLGYVEENKDSIDNLELHVDELQLSPIGSIVAWIPKTDHSQTDELKLPKGWIPCDGRVIPEPSIWAYSFTPDLNKAKRFLRGTSSTTDTLKLEEDSFQGNSTLS